MNIYVHMTDGDDDDDMSFALVLEDEYMQCCDLASALEAYISCFYVFNLQYPKVLNKTLQFIQRVYLNIKDSTKVHSRVYALIEKLS